MENDVLGNAMEGVPEESEEEQPSNSNIESADNLDEKAREELRKQVYDAMAEKEKVEDSGSKVESKDVTSDTEVKNENAGSEAPVKHGTGDALSSTVTTMRMKRTMDKMMERVEDAKESQRTASAASQAIQQTLRKPEEESPLKDTDAKQLKQEATVNGSGDSSASNSNETQEGKSQEASDRPILLSLFTRDSEHM
ncbi:hypothetical protein XENOCAPTIV_015888 [Xenoophorus captivus]|uniref:Uncharacterized protein n=1 Tax=Xenoophorus captivus TaxID=1517983 RepID=A0ABV0R8Z4_9TELE